MQQVGSEHEQREHAAAPRPQPGQPPAARPPQAQPRPDGRDPGPGEDLQQTPAHRQAVTRSCVVRPQSIPAPKKMNIFCINFQFYSIYAKTIKFIVRLEINFYLSFAKL